ncbi:hypothetical protein D3C77_750890 [compost metagenome]
MGSFSNQANDQRVRRSRGDKHRRGDRVDIVINQRQITANLAGGFQFRFRIKTIGDRLHNRVNDTTATRGITWRDRC